MIGVNIGLKGAWKHVKIGSVELGIKRTDDPDLSQPNPEIEWSWEAEVVVHKTIGQKPISVCTIPDGLWYLALKFTTLKGTDGGINEQLKAIRDMDAGPRGVEDILFNEGKCMFLVKKLIRQPKGSKDYYHTVELNFVESNPGS